MPSSYCNFSMNAPFKYVAKEQNYILCIIPDVSILFKVMLDPDDEGFFQKNLITSDKTLSPKLMLYLIMHSEKCLLLFAYDKMLLEKTSKCTHYYYKI